ncbi:MAG: FAS1-like dehydratase domain-containing protein [Candidatus Dormibacteria bacterium]
MPSPAPFTAHHYVAPAQLVDRDRHAAYARAVGIGDPAGLDHPLACFAAVYLLWPLVALLFSDPRLDLDLARLLHAEQEFWFERAIQFGESIQPRGRVERLETRRGMTFIGFACSGRDAGGQLVAHSRSLFLIREAA